MGWVIQGWGGSCWGRVGHAGVGWCGDRVGHVGVGWVMQGGDQVDIQRWDGVGHEQY